MTEYRKPSDVLEAVGVSGVLSAGLTWHVIGQGLAWAEFDKPADAVKFTMTKRGKGRKFAVMTFTPGKEFSGVIYLTSVKRGLDAGQVITESQLLDLYHGQEEKPAAKEEAEKATAKTTKKAAKKTSQASEKKPAKKAAQKPAKDTGFKVITLDHKDLAAPAETVKNKVVKALTNKPTKKAAKKSKSRIKLEKAQENAQAIDVTAAEFVAFCAKINAGRQKPYSAKNCELIFSQTGGAATDVRGFKSWIKAGRAVKKGQKSIVIEAPRFIYDEKGQPVLDKHGKPKMYAVPCCVFDIAQTEELKETKEA